MKLTLVQQITFITLPFIIAISLCGGWFAYHLTDTEFNRTCQEDDKTFMQVMVGLSVFLLFILWLFSILEFSQLTKLGY